MPGGAPGGGGGGGALIVRYFLVWIGGARFEFFFF